MSKLTEQVADEAVPMLQAGEWVAPGYKVIAHLHRGHYLDIYDVWSQERACRCIAKLLRPDRLTDRDSWNYLILEGRLLTCLAHPHLVRALETFEQPQPVLILETLTRATLDYLIGEQGRLRLADIAILGSHLCSAMHYLHRQGWLHLDLKPTNIVSACGIAKVIDLSLAHQPGRSRRVMGTRLYMAPEQVRRELLSEATDVWGIGGVLFEAATGQAPFEDLDEGSDYPQTRGRAVSLRVHRRVPAALARAIDGCLEPDPAQRPSIDELSQILAGLFSSNHKES
jgi:serine/threonine protein kinase